MSRAEKGCVVARGPAADVVVVARGGVMEKKAGDGGDVVVAETCVGVGAWVCAESSNGVFRVSGSRFCSSVF